MLSLAWAGSLPCTWPYPQCIAAVIHALTSDLLLPLTFTPRCCRRGRHLIVVSLCR